MCPSDGPAAAWPISSVSTRCSAVAESLYGEFKEQLYTPPSLLLRMVEAGLLGRKAGRGFYEY